MIVSMIKRDDPSLVVLDSNGVGMGPYQRLIDNGYRQIKAATSKNEPVDWPGESSKPNTSKVYRFGRTASVVGDGRVLIPEEASWLESFINEVAAFPDGKNDDQVDSMTQLLQRPQLALAHANRFASQYGVNPRQNWTTS